MYEAAFALFTVTDGADELYEAIRMLENEEYVLKNIDKSFQTVLLTAMEKVYESDISTHELGLEMDQTIALDEAITILENLVDGP